ncbi:MAG: hypothetical protein P8M11_06575 [Planctomycetota bacterium]|nr:hypothetical protein [Planctomycetota bacterium]MDG1984210.1 hypothetical protein [Planctomycetota bacterium]
MKLQLFTAATLALCSTAAAQADLIQWGPVQDVMAASEVSTNGTLVTAKNCWAQTFAAPTVNGVPFSAYAPPGWSNGGWVLTVDSTTSDAEYDALLDSARVTSGGSAGNPTGFGAINLDSLGTLAIGSTYEVQVWFCDQRAGTSTNVLNDRVMTMSSALGAVLTTGGLATNLSAVTQGAPSGPLDADPNNQSGATDSVLGSYCIGTFTRTSNDPLWLLVEGSHPLSTNVLRPHLNAFQLRDITGSSLGTNFCAANANSTGTAAVMGASGSAVAASNDLTLEATELPPNSFCFFLTSLSQGFVQNPGGSQGNLCLGGAIGRFVGPGQIVNSGATGVATLAIDLTLHPTPTGPVAIAAGETWSFTTWFRDSSGGAPTSNFSDGLEVQFN